MSSLADEYRRQWAWRDWPAAFAALPALAGARVLELGCGPGDHAAEFVARGAEVVGLDANEELLAAGRARSLARAEFRAADVRQLPELGAPFDGLWASFLAAYLVDLAPVLAHWRERLRPGAWIALTEVDDLFAHAPLAAEHRARLEGYVNDARAAGRYDFRMGRRLAHELTRAGFTLERTLELSDLEFTAPGPLPADVHAAWHARLTRMTLLARHCGEHWPALRDSFLAALAHPAHRSQARVDFVLARRG